MDMAAITPWAGFKREIDRLFDRMSGDWELPDFKPFGDWAPSVDFSESKDAYVVKAEIPGIDSKEIQVAVDNGVLTIKGEKKQEKEQKDEHYHRVERSYGSFSRSVRLPGAIEGDRVSATFKNGVLTVSLPKSAAAKGTQITVKAE
jgi:HSP20 family protein